MTAALALFVLGATLVSWAVAMRARARRSARAGVVHALVSPDPATRIAAVHVAAAHGISEYAEELLALTHRETSPAVLDAIAVAVCHNQWEPIATRPVALLRVWAAHRLATTRPTRAAPAPAAPPAVPAPAGAQPRASGTPAPPASALPPASAGPPPPVTVRVPRPVPPPTPPSVSAGTPVGTHRPLAPSAPRSAGVEVPAATAQPGLPPLAGLRPRRRPAATADVAPGAGTTVLVLDSASTVGSVLVRVARARGYRVIAATVDGEPASPPAADGQVVVPAPAHRGFVPAVCQAARGFAAATVVPSTPRTVAALCTAHAELASWGLRTWSATPHTVAMCGDPAALASVLAAHGLRTAGKPGAAAGTRSEPEFTVEALVGPDGIVAGRVAFRHLRTRGGSSLGGRTFSEPAVDSAVARILATLGVTGPASVQGTIGPEGTVAIAAVQPAFSEALALATAAGAELAGQFLDALHGRPIDPARLRCQDGLTIVRYGDELMALDGPRAASDGTGTAGVVGSPPGSPTGTSPAPGGSRSTGSGSTAVASTGSSRPS